MKDTALARVKADTNNLRTFSTKCLTILFIAVLCWPTGVITMTSKSAEPLTNPAHEQHDDPAKTDENWHEASVDAIDEGIARLLVGSAGNIYEIDARRLPEGAIPGTSLLLTGPLTAGLEAVSIGVDTATTKARQGRVRNKLDLLRQRSTD
ncbi:hypothetical protein HH1059_19420 [Halorhodospira halochloris]|uniref:DUF3006 domain-containing protein n=2 Tax=Halorhodospira halochloris TaxID=1052 RepID=A0A0X8XAV5_HALHR|nr:hypothetical protein HH1059_19420 [Halorhodospira halochloris]